MRLFSRLMAAHFKQFVREKSALFWTFAFPIVFILIFGAIFGGVDDTTFPIGLVIEDDSAVAGQLNSTFHNVSAFELHPGERDSEIEALITAGFGLSIQRGLAVASCTVSITHRSCSGSSSTKIPALTSIKSAPACSWTLASFWMKAVSLVEIA